MAIIKKYLMESEFESVRLRLKTDNESTSKQLLDFGFEKLPEYAKILDAGCGSGAVSEVIIDLANSLHKNIKLTLLDASQKRLDKSKELLFSKSKPEFVCSDLTNISIEDNQFDFIFCRFVFEYLEDQETAISELKRVLKPGGKLVIGDLDLNCLNHYPMNDFLKNSLESLVDILQTEKIIDVYAGRKLFSHYKKAGMKEVKANVYTHHLFCGRPEEKDLINWEQKLKQINIYINERGIKLNFDYSEFHNQFMKMLNSEDTFSYTPLIMISGTK